MEKIQFLKGSERKFLSEDLAFPLRPETHTGINQAETGKTQAEGGGLVSFGNWEKEPSPEVSRQDVGGEEKAQLRQSLTGPGEVWGWS